MSTPGPSRGTNFRCVTLNEPKVRVFPPFYRVRRTATCSATCRQAHTPLMVQLGNQVQRRCCFRRWADPMRTAKVVTSALSAVALVTALLTGCGTHSTEQPTGTSTTTEVASPQNTTMDFTPSPQGGSVDVSFNVRDSESSALGAQLDTIALLKRARAAHPSAASVTVRGVSPADEGDGEPDVVVSVRYMGATLLKLDLDTIAPTAIWSQRDDGFVSPELS